MRYASLMGSPLKFAMNSHSMFLWSIALKCSSVQLIAPGRCVDREGLSFFQGDRHWKLGHAPVSMSATQIRHVWSCLFSPLLFFQEGEGHKEKQTWDDREVHRFEVHDMRFPNKSPMKR